MEKKERGILMNPVVEQDRVEHLYELFKTTGHVMFADQRAIYENLAEAIPENASILDAGCGVGTGTAILHGESPKIPQWHDVVGIDISERNVRFAKQIYPHLTFLARDLTKGALLPGSDYVVCVEVIEHLAEVETVIANLYECANNALWLSTPNRSDEHPQNPYHVREYGAREMCRLIAEATGVAPAIHHPETLAVLQPNTTIDPLIYEVLK
jgi:2-polyprenyl-3-methyl-5-hydroxy-6-metoxy-1,4-benzoquinol methylase